MEKSREFLVSPDRLLGLAMELATLLYSHEGMCKWLGPYEIEADEDDYVADFYKTYFEERIGYLLLTLSLLIRTLDDRELIDDRVKRTDAVQIEVGKILIDDQWKAIDNFLTVLNFIIHAHEVIPNPVRKNLESYMFDVAVIREVQSLSCSLLIRSKFNHKLTSMTLNLRAFCDMVFRVVENVNRCAR